MFELGILRESHGKWERRAPLLPGHIQKLKDRLNSQYGIDLSVKIQPSFSRCVANQEYEKVTYASNPMF